jgi:uncharacterized protein with HEPN domain
MDKDRLYLDHIVQAISKIERYTKDVTLEDFRTNELIQDAVVRELEIVGEAVRYVSDATRRRHVDVPWSQISGMRNKLIHEYFGVDVDVVWKTITEDLPPLRKQLEKI